MDKGKAKARIEAAINAVNNGHVENLDPNFNHLGLILACLEHTLAALDELPKPIETMPYNKYVLVLHGGDFIDLGVRKRAGEILHTNGEEFNTPHGWMHLTRASDETLKKLGE